MILQEADIAARIAALEEARYAAMLAGDADRLAEVCSADLVYSHSLGDRDDRATYLEKVRAGHIVYHDVAHPIDRIRVLKGAALVTGRMTARVTVAGAERRIDNAYLAVWADEDDAWRLIAYQPTPLPAA